MPLILTCTPSGLLFLSGTMSKYCSVINEGWSSMPCIFFSVSTFARIPFPIISLNCFFFLFAMNDRPCGSTITSMTKSTDRHIIGTNSQEGRSKKHCLQTSCKPTHILKVQPSEIAMKNWGYLNLQSADTNTSVLQTIEECCKRLRWQCSLSLEQQWLFYFSRRLLSSKVVEEISVPLLDGIWCERSHFARNLTRFECWLYSRLLNRA